ncbi:hypothetical protein [Micromonospora sp. bgisy143]|uniref:hypothetical protein n=1 Tax=Micromonospora sp. bgisy143 TaxID=3413790 RepID=UPI003EBF6422
MTSESEARDVVGLVLPALTCTSLAELRTYLSRRRQMWNNVITQLEESGLQALGSWRTGQFHLSWADGFSFSDVDAWTVLEARHREATLFADADERRTQALRLSIHPYNYQQTLSLRAQKVLAVLNLAQVRSGGPGLCQYHLHKGFLALSKSDPAETYADTAARLGPAGLHALATKLGLRTRENVDLDHAVVRLLTDEVRAFTGLSASSWSQLRANLAEVGAEFLNDPRLSIGPEFRDYLRTKFLGGVQPDA